ncbi:MAG TPA: CBS domain-containing protein [Gemmatimonadales bacterium]|nr:CBS domain-containing protein [Gemmatimonadales bacterium]
MSAGRICSRIIATASPDENIRAAAARMAEYDVGTLVVLKENRGSHAVGVITDRDIVIRCVAENRGPDDALVSEVMTTPVHSVSNDTPIEEALAKMAELGTRRLVVTGEGGRVAGILTLDDVLDLLTREMTTIQRLLGKQQPKVPA